MPVDALLIGEIAKAVNNRTCIPFLGAAANYKCAGYDGLPLGFEVSESLAAKLVNETIADKKNLPRVTLMFERKVFRSTLISNVKDLIPDKDREPSRLLKVLASLPFDLYITTNYDRLLERALAPRDPVVIVQTVDALEGGEQVTDWAASDPATRRPLVYKIHGTFKDPNPLDKSPLIITEDDYIDFLTLLHTEKHAIPRQIQARLATNTLLFLGYSLEDWDFRVLYKSMLNADDEPFRPASYSVQKGPAQYWVNFWQTKKVNIIDSDIYEFTDALADACGVARNP
jgi:hypothetical protein